MASSFCFSAWRICFILLMTMLKHSSHSCFSSGVVSTLVTMRQPFKGGDAYVTLAWNLTVVITLAASSWLFVMKCSVPTLSPYSPKFLANEFESTKFRPALKNCLTAYTSSSRLPEANPKYAVSKKGSSSGRFWNSSKMRSHCAFVGSMPVGLCPQGCISTTVLSGRA